MRKPIFIFGMFVPVVLIATTRHIYESDGAQGIQNAINTSSAYDTVFVHTGTYYVRDVDSVGITMKNYVRLLSPHPDSVTLSGLNSTATDTADHVIYCYFGDSSSHAAMIKGFTITNGSANGSYPDHSGGGGIRLKRSSPILTNNWIKNNRTFGGNGEGGGVYMNGSAPILTNNIIENNSSSYVGGGIDILFSSPTIIGNTIKNNSCGGVFINFSSDLIFAHNVVESNSAGGILVHWCSPTLSYNVIRNNSSANGGGVFIHEGSSPVLIGNTIENNVANKGGACMVFPHPQSSLILKGNTIVNNVAGSGGVVYATPYTKVAIDSCFIVDNGSTGDTKSGVLYVDSTADTLKITHSHLYYNTFQPDTEIDNNTNITIPLENNFWWDTTEAEISALIEGPNDHTSWEYDFIPGVPGEPVSIDSIRNYDRNYSFIIDSLENDPDTLYLRIYGQDRNANFREAGVAIIKSSIYPTGIAVALVETDTNSGVYEGKATIKVSTGNDIIRLDDIYNIVKADTGCNTITITANMDTTQKFVVWYRCGQGVEEKSNIKNQNVKLEVHPNPFIGTTQIKYSVPNPCHVNISAYNLSGQRVATIVSEKKKTGYYTTKWNAPKTLSSGIYFIVLNVGARLPRPHKQVEKIVLIR